MSILKRYQDLVVAMDDLARAASEADTPELAELLRRIIAEAQGLIDDLPERW